MHCPFCGHHETQVKDSRSSEDGAAIRRRRGCCGCGQRFTTVERIQLRELTVIKNDGRKIPFDREKLVQSLRTALRKRPVDEVRQELLVNGLVRQLEASGEQEISSQRIGELAMDALREVDGVAYVRFASVYRDFREVEAFSKILSDMNCPPSSELGKDGP
ncbi:transcriptional regulator NrdR [Oecophyllibacter saccharovorans]|uniref:Transcriptional repressor NrdR n=1 Tax=Oecophyllibacter saccharovorans TaxID=2558360 RepID=A0A506UQL6_9PROT|nr:transcriptional regulator NrdR [Oecophyllibacter saccharovorans]QDH15858.1 transcriptional repressor NrdR [Oecophyllibacter saccharovorans]TPW34696.1 transcriptional repressor NrdR [Oecophyllibacter saccharovorans]TPW35638.1 transcriptional repressor NrdR [Oecophyllibacter saccharovorans]